MSSIVNAVKTIKQPYNELMLSSRYYLHWGYHISGVFRVGLIFAKFATFLKSPKMDTAKNKPYYTSTLRVIEIAKMGFSPKIPDAKNSWYTVLYNVAITCSYIYNFYRKFKDLKYKTNSEKPMQVKSTIIFSELISYGCRLQLYISVHVSLKLYCGYLYTRPCMINCIGGLKQLWLKVNGHAWFHLHEIHWAVRNRLGLKNSKWKYMSLAGFEPIHSAPRLVMQRLRPLGHAG